MELARSEAIELGAGRGPGRPAFEPTKEQREEVARSKGGGMSHEHIALALGICRQTLETHFADELSIGAYRKRMDMLNALYEAGLKGSVSAAREYLKHEPLDLAAPNTPAGADKPAAPPKPEGKKAEANEAAKTAQAGTGWDGILPKPQLTLVKQ